MLVGVIQGQYRSYFLLEISGNAMNVLGLENQLLHFIIYDRCVYDRCCT